MGGLRTLFALLLALIGFSASAVHAAPEPVTVRVALYPYVPGPYSLFMLLAREFQKRNAGVMLELVEVDPAKDYYGDGLMTLSADVYEIDTILLNEMLPRLAPLALPLDGFTDEAKAAVTRDGQVYAVPHWLCGNFLFYRKGDSALRDASTWSELLGILQRRNKGMVLDLYGRLTLGEWYLTLLAERLGMEAAQQSILRTDTPDPAVVEDLKMILAGCPTGFCRSPSLHAKTGFYARAFARGEAAAFVGYSEALHHALQEMIDNCGLGTACLSPDDIAVRRLPAIAGTAVSGIGWVDGLAVSWDAAGPVRDAALKFIAFATSPDGYAAALKPIPGEASRYLLPARVGVKVEDSPLYPDLTAAHAGRVTASKPGVNAALQTLSKALNCLLPIDRTDLTALAGCQRR